MSANTGRLLWLLAVPLLAIVGGFVGALIWSVSGLAERQTRAFLLDNPAILTQMVEALQRDEAQARLAGIENDVTRPFPGAVLGNPDGSRTLVEFTDYGCGYCKASAADVQRLVAADPNLRVVIREWPIFPGSEEAARMGLAAAAQGRFAAYHDAMFASGSTSAQDVARAASRAGLNLAAARDFARSDAVTQELARNNALAEQLAFTGTPSWVAGGQVIQGAVGPDRLAAALRGETLR